MATKSGMKMFPRFGIGCALFILGAVLSAPTHVALAQTPALAPASSVKTPADSDVKTISERFIVERPTLMSAGFEWMIHGDSNRTAKVEVSFRKKGESAWRPALPMMRLQNEDLQEDRTRPNNLHPPTIDYTAPNAFAGSVFNLDPDTDYDFRFVLSDPDGVKGPHEKIVNLRTRREPMPAQGGKIYHVYPADWKGPKEQPAFTGLLAASYTGAYDAAYWNGYPPRVKPGDIILMHAGVYKDTAFRYYMDTPRQ